MDIKDITQKAVPILRKNNIRRASVFGSAVRSEMTPNSDVDFLVELPNNITLFDLARIKRELANALGTKIDLVQFNKIKPLLRDTILSEQQQIYQSI